MSYVIMTVGWMGFIRLVTSVVLGLTFAIQVGKPLCHYNNFLVISGWMDGVDHMIQHKLQSNHT